jgi:peptide/nickel transport system substrate-binding protein
MISPKSARPRVDRRRFLTQIGVGLGAFALNARIPEARAMGRTPLGGRITMHVPWPTVGIDPHDLRDPTAALFAAAIADPVYAIDPANGLPYPTLAMLPTREGADTVVRLREGLRTARSVPLDARDLIASVERARSRGAGAILAAVPRPVVHKSDSLAAVFGLIDPPHLARALASPLVALLPRKFDSGAPDGTGAFHADISPSGMILTRNLNAARGPAFLDAIEIAPAEDLKTSLRSFEAERDDVGWLGMGLHDGRKGAVRFDLGRAAWVVLLTGPDAGSFGLPGVAQKLVDAIPPERLVPLGIGPIPPASGEPAWGGPPAELLVDDASPHLVEIARTVAPILSRPGHEVTATPVARAEIARRRARGKATLAIEVVRALGSSSRETLLSLATAEDPIRGRDLARATPKLPASVSARALTGTLRVGVLGEVRITGGVVPDVVFARNPSGEGWDLGATFRKPAKR